MERNALDPGPDARFEMESPEHHPPSVREGGRAKLNALDRAFLRFFATHPGVEKAHPKDFFGANLRWFNQAISGRQERFSEKDLAPWELEGLADMARAKAQKTGKPFGGIGYNDYNEKAATVTSAMGGHQYQVFDDGSTLNYEGSRSGFTPMMANLLIPPYKMKMVGGGGYKFRPERDIALGTRDTAVRGAETFNPEGEQSVGAQIGRTVLPWSGAIPVSIASESPFADWPPDPLTNKLARR